mgnify:CR=1 FL=1
MQLVRLWTNDDAQDIAEYAFMIAIVLVVTIVTIHAIGSNASTVFSKLASTLGSVS